MLRLLETYKPDRLIALRGASSSGDDPRGAIGTLGAGPLVSEGERALIDVAKKAQIAVQIVPDSRLRVMLAERWKAIDLQVASLPVLFAQTPVETVDARDVDTLAALTAAAVGLPPLATAEASAASAAGASGAVGATAVAKAYTTAQEAQPSLNQLVLYFGTDSAAETSALGVAVGQSATVRKQFTPLATNRATGRSMDDRSGSAALLLALKQIDPTKVGNEVTFAWSVEEETGLTGATHLAARISPDTAFAVDTFVSSDTPVDIQRLAGAKLGRGPVLRILDSRTVVPPHIVDRIVGIAREAKIPLQLGTTSGGTDAGAFSEGGALTSGCRGLGATHILPWRSWTAEISTHSFA